MAAEDWIPDFRDGKLDEQPVRCRYCGRVNFYWDVTPQGNWRLFTIARNKLHECKKYKENIK